MVAEAPLLMFSRIVFCVGVAVSASAICMVPGSYSAFGRQCPRTKTRIGVSSRTRLFRE